MLVVKRFKFCIDFNKWYHVAHVAIFFITNHISELSGFLFNRDRSTHGGVGKMVSLVINYIFLIFQCH